ncbi:uncharacterized protein LOC127739392 [Mytilus californianus]|uniref:uncharacterized protein LOC127739392 n=1 Tax=Mytilus californianus TaxID=6549 RepID=UPI002246F8C6|nr:uncharacterized protein LOC127739392 [Mytilus californianus]
MYAKNGQNLGASGFYNYPKDNSIPYNNDRLDDAVSMDYSQTLSGLQRSDFVASGNYASRIERSSDRRIDLDSRETSGEYATRIGSFTKNLTSTPDLPVRRNSGLYAQRIGNSSRNEKEISNKDQRFHLLGMDKPGRNMNNERVYENQLFKDKYGNYYPPPISEDDIGLQGLESPRSILETARSFPVGFEASDMTRSGPFITPPGESTDQGFFERHEKSSQRQKMRRNSPLDENLESETPAWANRLLTKESSLLSKFRNMKSAINKWTLRRISKPRIPFIKGQGPKVLDLFDALSSSSTKDLLPPNQHKEKTNNIASCFCGLFLMIIFVFPVIPVIVIFTDPSDFAQIEISIKFSGYVDANFDIRSMEQDICRQIDTAFSSYSSFYSCDLNNIRNGSITANVSLLFRVSNIPNENVIEENVNKQLTTVRTISMYAYEQNSTKTVRYTFVKQRLVSEPPYTRGKTTIDQTSTTISSTSAKEITTTSQVQTTEVDTSTTVSSSLPTEIMTTIETTKSDTTTSNEQTTSKQLTTTEVLTTQITTPSTITLRTTNPDTVTSSEQTATSTEEHTTTEILETTSNSTT